MKKIGKKWLVICIICFIVVLIGFLVINQITKDTNVYKISYRVYDKRHKWSKWYKNGETAGDGVNAIQKIEFKNNKKEDTIMYEMYENKKWISSKDKKNKIKDMYGIRLYIGPRSLDKEYNIFYRTFNKIDKWLEWSFNGDISGNIEKPITKIQIKVLKKEVSEDDYLQNYNLKNIKSNGFDE